MNQINLRSRFRVKKIKNQQYCTSFTHNDVKGLLGFKPANINFATQQKGKFPLLKALTKNFNVVFLFSFFY